MTMQDDARQMIGFHVIASDEEDLGTIERVYLDNRTQQPEFVSVKGGGLFGRRESLIPLQGSRLTGDRLRVPFSKQLIKDAPEVGSPNDISPDEGESLYRHYGLRSPEVPAQQTGEADRTGRMDDRMGDRTDERMEDRTEPGMEPGMVTRTSGAPAAAAGQAAFDDRSAMDDRTAMDDRVQMSGQSQADVRTGRDDGTAMDDREAMDEHTAMGERAPMDSRTAMDEQASMDDRTAMGAGSEAGAGFDDRMTAPGPVDRQVAGTRAWDGTAADRPDDAVAPEYEEPAHDAGRAGTEELSGTGPAIREDIEIIREPIAEGEPPHDSGAGLGEDEQVIILYAERRVVSTERIPVERVRIRKTRAQDRNA